MITVQVATNFDLTEWPREIVIGGPVDDAGGVRYLRHCIDCETHPASWEKIADTLETLAGCIRRDVLPGTKEVIRSPGEFREEVLRQWFATKEEADAYIEANPA